MSDDFKVVIPVRYDSVRFPGKPLADIHGRPMIQHVYEAAVESGASEVIIATDSTLIGMAAEDFGATVCMTLEEHPSGTDRIGEVVRKMDWNDDTIIVNLQGDEPLTPPELLKQVADNLHHNADAACATLCTPLKADEDAHDPHLVKVIFDANGMAIYFSRAALPYTRDPQEDAETPHYRHIGVYAYRASLLKQYADLPASYLEQHEKLEQLRLISNGYRIHVDEASTLPGIGVDTPEDLERVKLNIAASGDSAVDSQA